ncbi:hypothetical protein DDB_G0288871 [Dictyostelium discoideum AX4]|uniref:Uncharacterized protein n=1 Tax=Dictyostelium discoideum TaxID=44689 RepID=Q54IB9_DICDI|nr:hypothetical protein DDB_G0288871 [Dictyostelium discoideum AX4]EAL63057.1 hypothetical protein DDB_G0288871 [Dictyostelium discoideum AX4]|eukprot:XP_636558.1 hypothetical protein DDB_G0288871 [Dictyostelium discoideum AX4]
MNPNSEISPSYAMKLNSNMSDDIWGDNIEDSNPSYSPFLTCSMGHSFGESKNECYNFDFKNGAPISGKEFFLTPTFTHG